MCSSVMASMNMCLCIQLAELSHMPFRNFHIRRYAYFIKPDLEHEENSAIVSLNFLK
jgi:hypothetical protein